MAQSVNQQSVKLLVAFLFARWQILLFMRLNEVIPKATRIDFIQLNQSLLIKTISFCSFAYDLRITKAKSFT